MKLLTALVFVLALLCATAVQAEIVTKSVSYQHDDVKLEGFLAHNDSIQGKRPAVLVVHDWWGLNDYVRRRAEQLASMGYVAFAQQLC